MISIIVSTYKPGNFKVFSENVEKTIGVDYEIIPVYNPGKMGLCEAYNKGGCKAKYNYLCFCHEDIVFHTQHWGRILIAVFRNDSQVGLVGCAGSAYKPWIPSGWSTPQPSRLVTIHLIQTFSTGQQIKFISGEKEDHSVVTLDGCWLSTTKDVFDKIKFDEQTFKGYHCYDIDYALQVDEYYKVVVTSRILVEHLSEGSYTRDWLYDTYKLHTKWKNKLPVYSHHIEKEERQEQEYRALLNLMNKTLDICYCYRKFFKLLFSLKAINLMGLKNWNKVLRKTTTAFYYRFVLGR